VRQNSGSISSRRTATCSILYPIKDGLSRRFPKRYCDLQGGPRTNIRATDSLPMTATGKVLRRELRALG